MSIRLTIIGWS